MKRRRRTQKQKIHDGLFTKSPIYAVAKALVVLDGLMCGLDRVRVLNAVCAYHGLKPTGTP